MSIHYEEEGRLKLPFDYQELADAVIEEVLSYVHCPYESEVSLLLTMNSEIQELNHTYRMLNKATDVLSFPMTEYDIPGDFQFLESGEDTSWDHCFHPDTGELMLGDIVISKEKVLTQAEEYGHSPEREFAFLIAHSMLHLFGYDHIEESQRRLMEDKQEEILEKLHILRD